MENEIETCKKIVEACRKEAGKRLIGQDQLVDDILMAIVAGGHVLLEGVPGLAKTLTVKTFSEILGLDFKRIQFTPDLLPADVTGTLIYEQNKGTFTVRKGPIFSNIILADEINRAPAKVQSAMLEAMEERQITIGEETYKLPDSFFVLATQNPVEQEGTYNLPEAELDRFLMKLIVNYPTAENEIEIVKSCGKAPQIPVNRIISEETLKIMRMLADKVTCDEKLVEFIVSILTVTRPDASHKNQNSGIGNSSDITRYINFGASPRAGIAMLQCAKVHALFEGRGFVLPEDIKAVALNVLRHRIVLSYEAAADNITADEIISRILSFIPVP
ncbi:MAG: MoxR family ATPase [Spirochaetia bacterium]|nr:MoxR family ATPase [Treponema sp.]MCI6593287.1 MoxR family ATPase [Spirochaetia bacterium]MDD7767358.1 MoxR family ATPase [Treponema sp.]MDY3131134.1 MoxR family ATPase [Treponema sp.]